MRAPVYIKITKNGARIKHNDRIEIPVSRHWVRQYVEYALTVGQEVTIEIAP